MNHDIALTTKWHLTETEIAIWHSHMNCWQWAADNNEALLVFEDDAIIDDSFMMHFENVMSWLPDEYDFVSLWVPPDQEQDFFYQVTYDEEGTPNITGSVNYDFESRYYLGNGIGAKVYQGYSFVTTLYSPAGAQKLLDLAMERGMYTPSDCFLFNQAHTGKVEGYAPHPWYPRFIWHDDSRPSLRGI